MAVYVDTSVSRLGRMVMCHMAADSLDELHAIGVARRHYQGPPITKWPHHDICKAKRAVAVRLGALEVRRRDEAWRAPTPSRLSAG